jgi:hypothetical protein
MRIYLSSPGNITQQGNSAMNTKNIALAASVAMLVVISGQALAAPFTSNAMNAYASQQTDQQDTHRYFGGPKSND